MRRTAFVLLLVAVSSHALQALQALRAPQAPQCDRACLTGLLTQYFDALAARDPKRLPVAATVRFTEDAVEQPLGNGLWKTITKLRPYRLDIIDVRNSTAAAFAVAEEGPAPVLLALRLKAAGRRITEIETMVVRNQKEGMLFEPDALQTPSPEMTRVPDRAQLNSREEMIRIASLYPEGLRTGSFVKVDVPFAPGAYRIENGRRMAGPGCTFQPPSCENMKTQRIPTLPEMRHQLIAVDEEAGIVLFRLDFGAGSLPGQKDLSLIPFEAFKVYGGQIHAAEAIMEGRPRGASSGWD